MLGIFESMKNDKNRISQNYFAHSKIFSFIICIAYKEDLDLVDNTTSRVFYVGEYTWGKYVMWCHPPGPFLL